MLHILIIGAGGFVGTICRYLLSSGLKEIFPKHHLPYGTIGVNLLGCLVIGLIGGLAEIKHWFSHEIRIFLLIGVLGGFTTFSSFSYETLSLFRSGHTFLGLVNSLGSVAAGLLAVWIGFRVSRIF
jgi:fluoride exporter